MFDLGWTELLLIGIVALIVVGPKDLPMLFRNVGRFVGKAKAMAREFSRAMEDAADESGAKDIGKTLRDVANPKKFGMDELKKATDFKSDLKGWDSSSETGRLAADRAEAAKKIHAATAERAAKRRAEEEAREAAARDAAKDAATGPGAAATDAVPDAPADSPVAPAATPAGDSKA